MYAGYVEGRLTAPYRYEHATNPFFHVMVNTVTHSYSPLPLPKTELMSSAGASLSNGDSIRITDGIYREKGLPGYEVDPESDTISMVFGGYWRCTLCNSRFLDAHWAIHKPECKDFGMCKSLWDETYRNCIRVHYRLLPV